MNNETELKGIAPDYLKTTLLALIPIPFMVTLLMFFKLDENLIIVITFLVSVAALEFLYFRKQQHSVCLPASFDLYRRHTDVFMYGAISAEANIDDLIGSQELEAKAKKIYEWSEQ